MWSRRPTQWLSLVTCIGAVGCASAEIEAPVEAPPPPVERIDEPEEKEARIEVKMPALPGNASCRQARSAYHDAWAIEGAQRADLTRGQFGSVLARNSYFSSCRVPSRFEISICAAVQNGEVLGATVRTSPRAPLYERCIDKGVRKLNFPASPRMDVTTTVFASTK